MAPKSKGKTYYTLIEWMPMHSAWCIHFGDYSKSVVKAERDDMHDQGTRKAWLKIIESGDTQAEINLAVKGVPLL